MDRAVEPVKELAMERQSPLNVVLEVLPNAEPALHELLIRMRQDPGHNSVLPFASLPTIHFARLLLLPRANHHVGRFFPAKLVLTSNFDGANSDAHLRDLVRAAGPELVSLLSHCVGFEQATTVGTGEESIYAYLRDHQQKVAALYVNTLGRTVENIALEARLSEALGQHLDEGDWTGCDPTDIRKTLIRHVASRDDLKAALDPPPRETGAERWAGYARLGAVALIGIAAIIVLLPLMLLLLLVLRVHEVCNRPDNRRPDDQHIRELETDEDHGVHNQLSAVGQIQLGWFRAVLLKLGLFLLQLAARYYFNRGKLAEIDTIHFARWVMIDNGRRLYFLSNFDGSPESYQDDFIERVAFGLNLVFSNGNGWPRTLFLLFKGASDEQSFKAYYRSLQIPTQVWYTAPAYQGMTAVNIGNNTLVRQGLLGNLSAQECQHWLQRF